LAGGGGSGFGAVVQAAIAAMAARSEIRWAACMRVAGDRAEGVLFTKPGPVASLPPLRRRGGIGRSAASPSDRGEHNLAKPNFAYQKRQKELEKKRKKEEKLKRKVEKNAPPAADAPPPAEGAETA